MFTTTTKLILTLATCGMVSCAPQMPIRHKRYISEAARKDLQCTNGKLTITQKKKNHYAVRGCNGIVAYSITCVNHGPCKTEMTQVPTPTVKGE